MNAQTTEPEVVTDGQRLAALQRDQQLRRLLIQVKRNAEHAIRLLEVPAPR